MNEIKRELNKHIGEEKFHPNLKNNILMKIENEKTENLYLKIIGYTMALH